MKMRDESFHEICKASVAALGKFMMMVFSVMLSMFGSFIAGVLRAEEPILAVTLQLQQLQTGCPLGSVQRLNKTRLQACAEIVRGR